FDPYRVNGARLADNETLLLGATSLLWENPADRAVPYLRNTGSLRNEPTHNPHTGRDLPDFLGRLRILDSRLDRILHGFTFETAELLDPLVNLRPEPMFTGKTTLKLAAAVDPARVRYTLDGSEPTPQSTPYSGPISLGRTTTVKACWFAGDGKEAGYPF